MSKKTIFYLVQFGVLLILCYRMFMNDMLLSGTPFMFCIPLLVFVALCFTVMLKGFVMLTKTFFQFFIYDMKIIMKSTKTNR